MKKKLKKLNKLPNLKNSWLNFKKSLKKKAFYILANIIMEMILSQLKIF